MDNKKKRIITKEWLSFFPELQNYSPNKLYKIVEPFVIGIELINLPDGENYRPHFVIYSLYKENLKKCLEYPELMFEFFNDKGLQINLPYIDNEGKYKEAQRTVAESLKISLKGNICLKSFEDLLDDYFNRFSGGLHVGQIASLLELRFYAFLYLGNQIQIENTLNQILNASKNWEMQIFEIWFGKFEIWFEGLKSNYSNRKSFLKQIESNKQDKKIAKLYTVSLIP